MCAVLSTEQETLYSKEFDTTVRLLSAAMVPGKVKKTVINKMVTGEESFIDQVGVTSTEEVTTKFQDSPNIDVEYFRRRLAPRKFNWGKLQDNLDAVQRIVDPSSAEVKSAINAFGRDEDDILIAAMSGTSLTGKDGTTSIALPSTQKVPITEIFPGDSASNLFNPAKIVKAREILEGNDIDLSLEENQIFVLWNAAAKRQISSALEFNSIDFNNFKPLSTGEVSTWNGMSFILTERLTGNSTATATALVYVRSGVGFGTFQALRSEFSLRADKQYLPYAYMDQIFGATRLEETKVVEISFDATG